MNSTERVRNTILGKPTDRQPIYGWVSANLTNQLNDAYGSVAAFEDKYEFDASHIFGGPGSFKGDVLDRLRAENDELTPDILVNEDFFTDPDIISQYDNIKSAMAFHKERERFCYIQTPGFFEQFNGVFGIENQLLYLAMYPEELDELYRRQAEWTVKYAGHCIDLGIDMVHISDDWGAQDDMMFNPMLWWEIIYPHMKKVVDYVHSRGCLCSLHSDGCILKVTDGIEALGLDLVHPWQESAGMSYDLYLDKYSDKFAIMGGICIQTKLGLVSQQELERDIRRVFGLLRGKRWVCCTTHFVQDHCSIEDLAFAYDLIYKLARE
jgi:uroporphyrinogen decarboxylase